VRSDGKNHSRNRIESSLPGQLFTKRLVVRSAIIPEALNKNSRILLRAHRMMCRAVTFNQGTNISATTESSL
jgi:hypothetical protein